MLEFQTAWMAAEDAAKLLQLLVLCCSYKTHSSWRAGMLVLSCMHA